MPLPPRTQVAALRPAPLQRLIQEASKRPLLLKTVTSAAGFAFGDVLAQQANRSKPHWSFSYDRTARMAVAGALLGGPVGFWWLDYLNANLMPARPLTSKLKLSTLFVLDNVVGCALWQLGLVAADQEHRAGASHLLRQGAQRCARSLQALPLRPPARAQRPAKALTLHTQP